MANRSPLLRMIFLVSLLIFFLIIYSIQVENHSSKNIHEDYYSENVWLKNNSKAFSILKHTIKINDNLVSGYSQKFDSIMVFSTINQNIYDIKQKIYKKNIDVHNCALCHSY